MWNNLPAPPQSGSGWVSKTSDAKPSCVWQGGGIPLVHHLTDLWRGANLCSICIYIIEYLRVFCRNGKLIIYRSGYFRKFLFWEQYRKTIRLLCTCTSNINRLLFRLPPGAKFQVPDWADIVDSGKGLSYRPSKCQSRLDPPSQGLGI